MDGPADTNAQLKTPTNTTPSSTPYILLLPSLLREMLVSLLGTFRLHDFTYSANQPNTIMPIMIPTLVETFSA